jgi:hypothetical protein
MNYRLAGTLREAILNPLNAAKSHDEATSSAPLATGALHHERAIVCTSLGTLQAANPHSKQFFRFRLVEPNL